MKRTVKYLLSLLIGAVIVGMTACNSGSTTAQTASTNGWHTITTAESFTAESSSTVTTFAPASTSAPTTTTAASMTTTELATTAVTPVTTTLVTTAANPVTATAPVTTTAKPVTTTVPITTTTKPVTTAVPITTTANPVTTAVPTTVAPQEVCDYVLNTKSMVFHTQSCGSGKNVKAENREEFNGTWEELIAMGYSPCGNCDPAPDLADAPTTTKPPVTDAQPQGEFDYILNTKSMKFHTPDCGSASNIKAENRAEFSGTRDELIAEGYSPCGNCKP